jgi:hypothetical protein
VIPQWSDLPDPFLPEHLADPYPYYRGLRETARVHITRTGNLGFSRYADCSAILRDRGWGRNGNEDVPPGKRVGEVRSFARLNPPDHTRLRGLVAMAFTPSRTASLRPRIEAIVERLLDDAAKLGEVDIMTAVAHPLPITVICELLGVPPQDGPIFAQWCADINRGLDRSWALSAEQAKAQATARTVALRKLRGYLAELLEQRRADPADDLISQLIEVSEDSDKLTAEEVVITCRMLLIAGFEATVNLIGNGTLALLRNPDQRELVTKEQLPEGTGWIDELLRFDGPIQLLPVRALESVEYAGQWCEQGDMVDLLIGSANHDPEVFTDAGELDLTRTNATQLGFGLGIHYCLGAALARLEGQLVLTALFQRWPGMRLAGEVMRRPQVHPRGLDLLPVRLA